ncbi:unnamed protein product [Orchesella dallaii]|uniref:Uncharacterized protein n=1 Tax=Orchesella dallaii TaxID=48710 RepID=A0ABP1QRX1_9HEXA
MESIHSRKYVRIVGLFNLSLNIVGLVIALVFLFLAIMFTSAAYVSNHSKYTNISNQENGIALLERQEIILDAFRSIFPFSEDKFSIGIGTGLAIVWSFSTILMLSLVIAVYADINLIKSASKESNLEKSLRTANFWKIYNLCLLLLSLFHSILQFTSFTQPTSLYTVILVANPLIKFLFISVVWHYITEIRNRSQLYNNLVLNANSNCEKKYPLRV